MVEVRLWERNKRELVVIVLDPSSYTDTHIHRFWLVRDNEQRAVTPVRRDFRVGCTQPNAWVGVDQPRS